MANKKETPEALTNDDLVVIEQIILQATIKASDATIIASILTKLKNMIK